MISVVVVNWNGGQTVLKAIRAILKAKAEKEVWLVDNASSDGSLTRIREEFPQINLIENSENKGFATANNQAISKARGDFVILVNPDTEVAEDAFQKTIEYFRQNTKVGIIGGQLQNEDGSIQRSGRNNPTFLRELIYYSGLWGLNEKFFQRVFDYSELIDWNKEREVDEVSGAYLAVRQQVIHEIGALDDNFFMYYEDTDLCLRTRKKGWRVVYDPQVKIKHLQGRSAKILPKRVNAWLIKSAVIYARKWYPDYQYLIYRIFWLVKGVVELSKLTINDILRRGDPEDRRDAKRVWQKLIFNLKFEI